MKNVIKTVGALVVLIAAATVFAACVKGGTIEVTNATGSVSVVAVGTGVPNITGGKSISVGGTESWDFEEDGVYTVIAVPPVGFSRTVTLLGGNTEKVKITP